jgi:hypothetical protein
MMTYAEGINGNAMMTYAEGINGNALERRN